MQSVKAFRPQGKKNCFFLSGKKQLFIQKAPPGLFATGACRTPLWTCAALYGIKKPEKGFAVFCVRPLHSYSNTFTIMEFVYK